MRTRLFVGRARQAAAAGPFGHHIHWTSPTHARPTGRDPAAAVLREGAWLREQGLEPRFFCGGGWYTGLRGDGRRGRPRVHRLHRDRVAPLVPPARLAARRARPAGLGAAPDGRRVLELPTTHSLGALARALHRQLPPVVHVHFHDYELLEGRRRSALVADAPPARAAPGAGGPRRPRRRRARSLARRMRKLIGAAAAAAALVALAGCGSSSHASAIAVHVDSNPFRISILHDGKTVVAEDEHARLRYQLASTGDEFFLTKVISAQRRHLPGGDERARPHGDGHGRADRHGRRRRPRARTRRTGVLRCTTPSTRRRTSTSSAAASTAQTRRPARADPRDRGGLPVLLRPDPVLRELGGLGAPARQPEHRRLRVPGLAGRRGCQIADDPPARSRRSRARPRSASRGASSTSTSTSGSLAADALRLPGGDR